MDAKPTITNRCTRKDCDAAGYCLEPEGCVGHEGANYRMVSGKWVPIERQTDAS